MLLGNWLRATTTTQPNANSAKFKYQSTLFDGMEF